jgi:FG-GAP-like repeat
MRLPGALVMFLLPELLLAALAPAVLAQGSTTSTLTVQGSDPYNLSCSAVGLPLGLNSGPTGSVTFTDVTTNQTLAVKPLGASTQGLLFVADGPMPSTPSGAVAVAEADLYGDGRPVLVILANSGVFLSAGRPDRTFSNAVLETPLGAPGAVYELVVTGDFNGDGAMDVAIAYTVNGSQRLQVLLNQRSAGFQALAPTTFALPSNLSGLVAVDFSGSGIWGLVVGDADSGTVESIASDSTGTLHTPVSYAVSGNTSGLVTGDFNGDQKTDVAVTTTTGVAVLLNTANGRFGSPAETNIGYSSGQPIADDYTGDGVLDLLLYHAGQITLLTGKGDGSFHAPGSEVLTQEAYMVGGDFNGDGKPDLALETLDTLGHPNALEILQGDGAGRLVQVSSVTGFFHLNDILTGSAIFFGDGRSDLLGLSGNGGGQNQAGVWLNVPEWTASATAQNVSILARGASTHNLTCAYGGDSNFAASTSSAVSVAIPPTGLAISAGSTSQTVTPGMSASYALTLTGAGGYTGTVTLACGSMPNETSCSFSSASLALSGGAAAQSTLTVNTTAATTSRNHRPGRPSGFERGAEIVALAVLLGPALWPGRTRRWNRQLQALLLCIGLAVLWLPLSGCSGGGASTPKNPGTPAGTYTVTVTAADSSGSPTGSTQLTLVVQ